jgi:cytochrome b561
MAKAPAGYSPAQIGLHWAVVVLIAFQYAAHNGMEAAWTGFLRAESRAGTATLAYLHIAAGTTILILVLLRLYLRLTRGVPAPPAEEPRLLQIVAGVVHLAIYGLLFLLPLSGAAAWFIPLPIAGTIHALLTDALLVAIALHVAGALFQHFVRRSDVLMRMFRTREEENPAAEPSRRAAASPKT